MSGGHDPDGEQGPGRPTGPGRPPLGPDLVDRLDDCSESARLRLKVILQTIAGSIQIEEACTTLGIERSAFNRLRSQFVSQAVQLLEPQKTGRKKKVISQEQAENQRLLEENQKLKFQMQALQLREEIGIVMPHLLRRRASNLAASVKKTPKNR